MRDEFHRQVNDLLDALLSQGDSVAEMLGDALKAVAERDEALADRVIERDNRVDETYEQTQHGLLRTIALQAPVASDLRLLSAMLHVNIHVERMGDYATSVAKMAKVAAGLRDNQQLAEQLREMGEISRRVADEAFRSFARRDVELARAAAQTDDGVDRLNIGIFQRLVHLAAEDERRLEWATHMILVARLVERWSDHAVDIAEQTIFVVTGSTIELSSNDPHEPEGAEVELT